MLSLIRHSSLPLPIKTFMEQDPTLTQFIDFAGKFSLGQLIQEANIHNLVRM